MVYNMKKIAIIFNGKNNMYESHYYNILFKILPFGNIFTYITCGATVSRIKENTIKEIKGKYKLIQIYDIND